MGFMWVGGVEGEERSSGERVLVVGMFILGAGAWLFLFRGFGREVEKKVEVWNAVVLTLMLMVVLGWENGFAVAQVVEACAAETLHDELVWSACAAGHVHDTAGVLQSMHDLVGAEIGEEHFALTGAEHDEVRIGRRECDSHRILRRWLTALDRGAREHRGVGKREAAVAEC